MKRFNPAKGYSYKGYIIRRGKFGWYGKPVEDRPNEDRWGYTRNYRTAIEAEVEIDNKINNN